MIKIPDEVIVIPVGYIGPGIAIFLQIAIASAVGSLALAGWYWKKIVSFLRRKKNGPKERN